MTAETEYGTTENVELAAATSNYVYIRSAEYGWIPARLESREEGNAAVLIPQYKDEKSIKSDGGRSAKKFEKAVVDLEEYPNNALPLQNVDEDGNLNEVEDMVDLPFLHEAAIMYNLKARHIRGIPYTRTGDIVIACNPYKWMMDLYSEKQRSHYANALVFESSNDVDGDPRSNLEPHVYEASSLAYRGLAADGEDQSILVSGESGAGKTETVKILLSDLASVQQGHHRWKSQARSKAKSMANSKTKSKPQSETVSPIVQRVLDSNPLLEAFGNAKTARNDNSSRFGKYIQLQFDGEDPTMAAFAGRAVPSCVLAGSKCEVYLLEKSRVVGHEEEERTYHIFYQLLAAPEEQKAQIWEGLEDTDNESFGYVGWTDTNTIEDATDGERFKHTLDSLALVGVEGDKLKTLMQTICVVLQLGNLVFDPDPQDDEKTLITTEEELEGLSDLMGIDIASLNAALLLRTVRANNEEYKVPLNQERARDSCDAFAKEIYAKTFLWLVRTINDATSAEKNYDGDKRTGFGIIGLLDIFGFESFEINRFEQLCINYANEKLQQKFTQDIFRSVQAEYEYEGIELGEIKYDDNADVLDLVEGRMGLLSFLNEECVRPKGSDTAFVSKVYAMNKENQIFITKASFRSTEFGIVHYAGTVIYDATNFVTKNMDNLPTDLQDCAKKSTNDIIANHLANDAMISLAEDKKPKKRPAAAAAKKRQSTRQSTRSSRYNSSSSTGTGRRSSNIVASTVWTKFKDQLSTLMTNLSATRTRYIRCIKPNQLKQPQQMEHISTLQQLRCAGVVAAVTISRSAFPNRLEHEIVLDRFRPLWKKGEQLSQEEIDSLDPETRSSQLCDKLLTSALIKMKTMRDGVQIQAFVIGKSRAYFRAGALEFLESERIKYLAAWTMEIQRIIRGFVAHSKYNKIRKGSIILQSIVRKCIAHSRYQNLRAAVIKVQCWNRCLNAARTLVIFRRNYNATLIQTHWRMAVAITMLKTNHNAAVVVQSIVRGALQRPKYRQALKDKKEEAKLENQLRALQKKLEEAESRRLAAEKKAEERAKQAVQEYRETTTKNQSRLSQTENHSAVPSVSVATVEAENDDVRSSKLAMASGATATASASVNAAAVAASGPESVASSAPGVSNAANSVAPSPAQLSAQQQTLMDESGKMLEYLRKEVFKLRSQNAQMRTDFDLLKDNNQRLMDANASAGASFAALNQHAKQLSKTNAKLATDIAAYKQQIQKHNVLQVELREELKMKQATYIAEVHSRIQYQKALTKIVDTIQERCRDTRLVEDILSLADECESDYMGGPSPAGNASPDQSQLSSSASTSNDQDKRQAPNLERSSSILSKFASYWS